jgi:hypothetical protein
MQVVEPPARPLANSLARGLHSGRAVEGMRTMRIDNEIPRSHPFRGAIEQAIADVLREAASTWKAWIHVAPYKRIDWIIHVETGHGGSAYITAGPSDQNPEFIGSQLKAALANAA